MHETAVITGAAGGIGAAVAGLLAADGVRCVVVDREPHVTEVADRIGGEAVVGDLTDPETSTRAVALAGDRLDLLVLNAGTNSADKDPATLDLDRYHRVVGINQHAVMWGLRAALPVMRRRGGGSIAVTASLAAIRATPQDPVYTMTKHAVIGLVRSLSGPLSEENITLGAVCPGLVDTPLTAPGRDRFRAAGIPMLPAETVAAAAVRLLRLGEPGTELVVRPGRPDTHYRPAPLP
ncbi:NAD(P)-dependent dehydrogenase (short-subunit alcohol dehydrogenase family) [Nocardia transvalensis]|uniref:NAD(P)-dependent dehydrogenase (Short-subunit alcohol dehydrogenase family) n=1 Tax=Nocardia transvalensis TaxID=37333 RepID=A0A7W9ULR1_9NOCA|nr:SDR family oxidoreductase [Nocardia transvalensis]MBB5917808.1 NAD(P)-dependent dehydrogenase (short-subunit alcohol dehydrogenase family) [Nocardia transvalensis]